MGVGARGMVENLGKEQSWFQRRIKEGMGNPKLPIGGSAGRGPALQGPWSVELVLMPLLSFWMNAATDGIDKAMAWVGKHIHIGPI